MRAPNGGGVLDYLELGMLTLGHDEVAVESAVGLQLRHVLHHRVVGPDGVCGDDVHIGQRAGDGDGLGAADQLFGGLLEHFILNGGGH